MIKLSRLADYGVVVLGRLATMRQRGAGPTTAAEIAEATLLPAPTVAKILKLLARGEVVCSHRGHQGGYSLARDPGAITVADLVTALDGPVALTACVDGHEGDCSVESMCAIRGHWDAVNTAVRAALESVTLADMILPGVPPMFQAAVGRQGAEKDRAR